MADAEERKLAKRLERVEDELERLRRIEKYAEYARRADADLRRDVLRQIDEVGADVRGIVRRELLRDEPLDYPQRLTAGGARILSQNQEDGITLQLLRAAGMATRTFVEIGCGTNGGNSGFLAEDLGFGGLMIDGGELNAAEAGLRFPGVTAVCAWVTREGVDALLTDNGVSGEIDLLSIDIDGNDLWVWEALTAVQPRVVIAEFNSLYGPEASLAVPYDPQFVRRAVEGAEGTYFGASLTAFARVGARKGYRLVCTETRGVNAFFVRDDLAPEIPAATPQACFHMLEHQRARAVGGFDLVARAAELGLPLTEIS